MNPSASNWIEKYFSEQKNTFLRAYSYDEIYQIARNTGFSLGHTVHLYTEKPIDIQKWTSEEITKVALLNTLGRIYFFATKDNNSNNLIDSLNQFYTLIHKESFSLTKLILPQDKPSIRLENIIDSRIQTRNNTVNKNFYNIFTNAILFMDVLAFRYYLEKDSLPEDYFEKYEQAIVIIITLALETKSNNDASDENLIKLFEDSFRYTNFKDFKVSSVTQIDIDYFTNPMERYYLLDICIMCLFTKTSLTHQENEFFYHLGEFLDLPVKHIIKSVDEVFDFINNNETEITYFKSSNLIKNFYNQSTDNISLLLTRNKKRLAKELKNDKDLMILLAKSTTRDLNKKEKEQVKKQLLDICKTIPSLTIFLLPGGSLLLPILIKFIPQLLPSSFNENLDINDKKSN